MVLTHPQEGLRTDARVGAVRAAGTLASHHRTLLDDKRVTAAPVRAKPENLVVPSHDLLQLFRFSKRCNFWTLKHVLLQ